MTQIKLIGDSKGVYHIEYNGLQIATVDDDYVSLLQDYFKDCEFYKHEYEDMVANQQDENDIREEMLQAIRDNFWQSMNKRALEDLIDDAIYESGSNFMDYE